MKLKFVLFGLCTLSILLILSFVFYWYEWRPTTIRQSCVAEAIKADYLTPNDRKILESMFPEKNNALDADKLKAKNNAYRYCLIENGLKPESLYN